MQQQHRGRKIKRTLQTSERQASPESSARWLRETQAGRPGCAMPQFDVNAQDTRNMTAYFWMLR